MAHPLTDEIAENIAPTYQWASDIGDIVFRHRDMRAATDWQLEQCITWLERRDGTQYKILAGMMREAMRPQTQEDN